MIGHKRWRRDKGFLIPDQHEPGKMREWGEGKRGKKQKRQAAKERRGGK